MNLSAGNVTVNLLLNSSGFGRALGLAGGQLRALQKQVVGIAQSFKFIGGFAIVGGIASAVESIAEFEDGLGALKGVLSGSIKDSRVLDENVQQLGIHAREVALQTGFLATELVQAEVEFVRAGISAKATAENLATVANLARTENIGLAQAAEVATNILLGLNLTAEDFTRVVDIITAAANASSSSVLELAQSFKFVASVGVEFNQSAETLAASLAVLANAGIKGQLAGTSLRQIFKVLVDDFNKGDSVLKRFNISLFKGGEQSQTLTSEFRSVTDILGDLREKAGTATEFIQIFQARALAGSLVLSRQTSEELAKLAERLGSDVGAAARIGAFRLETLRGQFGKLKASAQEFFLSLGFQGGLLPALTGAVQRVTAFVNGLAQLRPRMLQLVVDLGLAAAKTVLFGAGLVGLGGAAALLLSPLGQVITAITAVAEGPSILQKYGPELRQLRDLFLAFAESVGASLTQLVARGFFELFSRIHAQLFLLSQTATELDAVVAGALVPVFGALTRAMRDGVDSADAYAQSSQELAQAQLEGVQSGGLLHAVLSRLDAGTQSAAASYDVLQQSISQATAKVGEIRAEYEKLLDRVKSSNTIPDLIESVEHIAGSEGAVEQLRLLSRQFEALELQIENVKRLGSPAEILLKGQDELRDLLMEVEELGLRPFDVETLRIIENLKVLQQQLAATGGDSTLFDPIIEQAKELRRQLDVVVVDLAEGFRQGFRSAIEGVLLGTREFDFKEILRQGLVHAFVDAFDKIILEKLKFDQIFKRNILDLGKFAKSSLSFLVDFFAGLFGGNRGGSTGTAGAGSVIGGAFGKFISSIFKGGTPPTVPALAAGGIAVRPTLAMVGDAGREAILPLDRLRDFEGGTQLHVHTVEAPRDVEARQSGSGGTERIFEVFVGRAARDVARGGPLRRAMDAPRLER